MSQETTDPVSYSDKVVLVEVAHIKQYLKASKCKPLSKKQMSLMFMMIDHKMQHAQMVGFKNGKQEVENKYKNNPLTASDKSAFYMTLQRLGDANAQMTTSITRLLEKL